MDKINTVSKLLREVRLRLSQENGTVLTQAELAAWYGIDPIVFNKYYNGKRAPVGENLYKIGAKTPEIYNILGISQTSQRILELSELYKNAPEELKDVLFEKFKKVIEELGISPLD